MKKIIDTYKHNIKTIIKKFTGKADEDLEQEVLIKAWKNKSKYNEQNRFKQWISTITANTCRDYLKSSNQKNSIYQVKDEDVLNNIADKSEKTEKIIDQKLRQKIILKAVYALPAKMKEVIILYEFEEMSYEEISKKIKTPIGTIKSRLFNARNILAEELKHLSGD
ncbi:MAG: sigma-70 family RNA polymerase sigma factor [Candidatus Gastranaerophilales bacterium]|nr:sigma-70 family RNA polymerase sigma factor [Candidatus Gastranaerophilales bacterium]